MTEPSVFIIDDDPAVRDALVTLIDSVGHKVSCYADADSFLCNYDNQPGCLISDVCLPGIDGIALQQILHKRDITLPMIVISAHGDIPMAVSMLRQGALDFIEKPFRNHIILKRVQEALQADHEHRMKVAKRQSLQIHIDALTPREREILPLLTKGLSNKLIARSLNLSPRTVEAHRAHILKKMNVESTTTLTALLSQLQSHK